MSIERIKVEDLRRMKDKEGLILQGCGGDPQEWLDGINDRLKSAQILRNGSKFENCFVFENEGCICILFPFEGVEIDVGRLALWRLQTHNMFSGKWLSDYVPNRLGGFVTEETCKPKCPIIGADGNIFNVMGIAARTLKENGQREQAREMQKRVTQSGSYREALGIIMEYVEPVSEDEMDEEMEGEMRLE